MVYILAIFTFLVFFYGLKNAAGINMLSDFSLSSYFPFSLLKLDKIVYMKDGRVNIEEDFDSPLPIPTHWRKVHTPAPDSVSSSYARQGLDSSRCLIVTNLSNQRWHITHRYRFAVKTNEKYYLEALLFSKSSGGYAEVQISGYDSQGYIVKRDMWHISSMAQGSFEKVHNVFSVTPGIASIQLRLAGKGQGEFRFDNIRFKRLE
jgi:hypothetical protein